MNHNRTSWENLLHQHDDAAWARVIQEFLPAVHPVDKEAVQIWFAFWPNDLRAALDNAPDRQKLEQHLLMRGNFNLAAQIDTSHAFFYGHRYWPQVKNAVAAYATRGADSNLAQAIRTVAAEVAAQTQEEESLLLGITAVGFMTLQQVGLDALRAAAGRVSKQHFSINSPARVLSERAQDDKPGLFGFLRTIDKRWTVRYDENKPDAKFQVMNDEELASAAARDQSQDWRAADERCIEGPIPVECRSAACGTCWVGVLGGAEKLSPVSELEAKRMKLFGYINTDAPRPVIRLACMARAEGAVSVVLPSWNGVFAKYLKKQQESAANA